MKLIRWGLFAFFALVTLGLLARLGTLPAQIAAIVSRSANTELEKTIADLKSRDPAAAAKLASIQDDREKRALEAAFRTERRIPGGDPVKAAESLTRGTHASPVEHRVELARMALDSKHFSSDEQREDFVRSHGTALDALAATGSDTASPLLSDYFNDLRKAATVPAIWHRVENDPVGLKVFQAVESEELRRFYAEQSRNSDHPDWLVDLISEVALLPDEPLPQPESTTLRHPFPFRPTSFAGREPSALSTQFSIEDVLRIAHDNHPHLKQFVIAESSRPDEERCPTAGIVAMFREHGPTIRFAVGPQGKVPLSELMDVMFANEDFIATEGSTKGPEKLAAYLVHLHLAKPAVWREAAYSPLALRLEKEAPDTADAVLERYGPDGVATLVLCGYEGLEPQACASIAKLGDVAIYVLNMYADEPKDGPFHASLAKNTIGPRLIPYVLRFEDKGLERLTDNSKWLDKYFEKDGTPIDPTWYETLPGGGFVKVCVNFGTGVPSEWSELGWAALDVADAALLVGSFGASAELSASKSAAKTAAITASRRVAEAATHGSRTLAKQSRSVVARRLFRSSAIELAKSTTSWMKVVSVVWRVVRATATIAYEGVRTVLVQANRIRKAWGNVPANVRRYVYRGLLAATLYAKVRYHTLPNMPSVGKELAEAAAAVVNAAGTTAATVLATMIREILGPIGSRFATGFGFVVYVALVSGSAYLAFRNFPRRRGTLRYV